MSVQNGVGIWKWDADVAGWTIDLDYDFKADFANTTPGGDTFAQTLKKTDGSDISGTETWTRVTCLGAVGANEFSINSGRQTVGDPVSDTPPFFRKIVPEFDILESPGSSILFEWIVPVRLRIVQTGGTTSDDSWDGTLTYNLSVRTLDNGTIIWDTIANLSSEITGNWIDPIGSLLYSDGFAVDEITLQKAGSDDWGFDYDDTIANPGFFPSGGYTVTAWDVHHRLSATVS